MPKLSKKFWSMKNLTTSNGSTGEIVLYGEISEYSWWGDEVTPKQFAEDLASLGDVSELVVRINSSGGDVPAGMAIRSMLKRHAARVTVYVDGLAASIASVVAMAGDRIIMPRGSMMMIHNPWSSVWGGDADDFRSVADTLDKVRDALVEVYEDRTKLPAEEIKSMMDAETWMTATEAVDKGFADEVEDAVPISAQSREGKAFFNGLAFNLDRFRNAPKLEEPKPPAPQQQPNGGVKDVKDLAELKAKYPEIYNQAVQEGVSQERGRLKALDELGITGEIVNKAKYETFASAEATAMEIIKARQQQGQNYLANAQTDASGIDGVTPSTPEDKPTEEQQIDEAGGMLAKFVNQRRGGRQ